MIVVRCKDKYPIETDTTRYRPLDSCPMCGSKKLSYRAVLNGVKAYCEEERCWFNEWVPLTKSLQKRTNSTLSHWAANIKAEWGHKCAICGSSENIEAHHIIPVANSEDHKYDSRNGVALCKRCHYLVHHKKKDGVEGCLPT